MVSALMTWGSPEDSTTWFFSMYVIVGMSATDSILSSITEVIHASCSSSCSCSLRLDGDGITDSLRGAGNFSRGTRGEDRERPCAGRSLLLVAAEEARVRTARDRGRCTADAADSDDLPAVVDVVGTLLPTLALVEVCSSWYTESTALEAPAS